MARKQDNSDHCLPGMENETMIIVMKKVQAVLLQTPYVMVVKNDQQRAQQ